MITPTVGGLEALTDPESRGLRIAVISEVEFLGEALQRILATDPSVSMVRRCPDLDEAMAVISGLPANVVLVDAALPDGAVAVERIRGVAPEIPVIVFGLMERGEEIFAWAEAGITGYIPTTARLAQLVPLLVAIVAGEQPISARAAAELFRRLAKTVSLGAGGDAASAAPALSRRERQVAELVAIGLDNAEIARRLIISLATTKSHVHNLLGKLNLRRRSQVAQALREHYFGLSG